MTLPIRKSSTVSPQTLSHILAIFCTFFFLCFCFFESRLPIPPCFVRMRFQVVCRITSFLTFPSSTIPSRCSSPHLPFALRKSRRSVHLANTTSWPGQLAPKVLLTGCSVSFRCTVRGLILKLFKALLPTLNALAHLISCRLHLRLCLYLHVLVFRVAAFESLLRAPLHSATRILNTLSAAASLDTSSHLIDAWILYHRVVVPDGPYGSQPAADVERVSIGALFGTQSPRLVGRRARGRGRGARANCGERASVGAGVGPPDGWGGGHANGTRAEGNS